MLLALVRVDASPKADSNPFTVCCGEPHPFALSPQSVVIELLVESVV